MPERSPIEKAVQDLRGEVGSGHGAATAEEAWSGFLRFGRRRYDSAETPDSDGLLFQFGTFSFDGPPMFLLDFTRQFEVNDTDGDHDHYVQVHYELRYAPDPELRELGSFNSWFFHDSEHSLDQWSATLGGHEIWGLLRHRSPVDLRISAEDV